MPKKLHTRVLKIVLWLLAALAAKQSGGSHHALPWAAHLAALILSRKPPPDAEALVGSGPCEPGICSPLPASCRSSGGCRAGEPLTRLGLRLRRPLHIPGWERTCFSPGCPALVQHQCRSAMEGRVTWLMAVQLARGCLAPRPGWPGVPASEIGRLLPTAVSGHPPPLHPGMRMFPWIAEVAPL